MPEIDRLSRGSDSFELDFVEREATPEPLMGLSIQLHVAELSLSDTISILDEFGVDRVRSTVHNWVQKTDQQPTSGRSPDYVAVDETVIQLDDKRYWLYDAVDPETNIFLHVKLLPARTTALTENFLQELTEKHDVDDAVFLVEGAPWLKAALYDFDLRFQHVTHGNCSAGERVFKEAKRRTEQFDNHFRYASAESAENWLQVFNFTWNQLI